MVQGSEVMTAVEEFCDEYKAWLDNDDEGYDALMEVSWKLYDLLLGERRLDDEPDLI